MKDSYVYFILFIACSSLHAHRYMLVFKLWIDNKTTQFIFGNQDLTASFRSHNKVKLFLYIINTQNKWKTTSLYYILWRTYILNSIYDTSRAKTPNANPLSANRNSGHNHPGRKHWSARNHPDSNVTKLNDLSNKEKYKLGLLT